jgi:flagellar motor switch protein FliN/FliY
VNALVNEAAEAAVQGLSARQLLAGYVAEGTEPAEFIPGPGARAVTCRMRGLEGQLVLVVSAELAEEIVNGPMGNQDFAVALEPSLSRAGNVLDQAAPRALRIDAAFETAPEELVRLAAEAWWFGAAPLFAGEDHVASLAVVLTDPEVVRAAEEADGDDEHEMSGGGTEAGGEVYTPPPPGALPAAAPGSAAPGATTVAPLRLLHDVEMEVTVELGRTRMTVRSILGLVPGAVIELDRAAGSPVDLLVNGKLIGRGEVVVIDEEFGVRISEIVGRSDDQV